jgi:catechol 2,3-dioxygenase-like lactoylglutathione lyase family enzyme
MAVESLSAITLSTADPARSVAFYEAVGFRVAWRSADESFIVLHAGEAWLNLQRSATSIAPGAWGRFILHVDDVDAAYARMQDAGYAPEMAPSDAPWGERYFHVRDPDGHEVSIARRFRPIQLPRD